MCISTGRICEYRVTLDRRTKAWRLEKTPVQSGQVDLTLEERYYLDFFRKVTSLQCAGYFFDEFWQRLVHQVSETQPAVRHAVIGMGALNHSFVQIRIGEKQGPLDISFSLRQINKAIAGLQENLKDENLGRLRVEIALTACVVLASTVIYQEDSQSAGRHLQSGFKLLEHYMVDHAGDSAFGSALSSALGAAQMIWTTFHNPEGLTNNKDRTFELMALGSPPSAVSDNAKTTGFLIILSRLVIQKTPGGFSMGPASPELESEIMTVLMKLRLWQAQIKQSLHVYKNDVAQQDTYVLTLLEVWIEVLHIKLIVEKGPLSREEKYDDFTKHFQKILSLTQSLSFESIPPFPIATTIVPPLIFCAFKCRDLLLRQKALCSMQQWRWQEGIHQDDLISLVAKRVIDIESRDLKPSGVIPQVSRIESFYTEIHQSKAGAVLWYRCALGLQSKDYGPEDWHSEWIPYEANTLVLRH